MVAGTGIFTEFRQLDSAAAKRYSGTALGLALPDEAPSSRGPDGPAAAREV